MKAAAAMISGMDEKDINKLEKERYISLSVENEPIEIGLNDVEIIAEDIPGWSVANKNNLTVALDISITLQLQEEGNAREIVNRIQKIRKDNGYDLTDRIVVNIQDYEPLKSSIINFSNYICAEILADEIHFAPEINEGTEIEVNEATLKILISKK